MIYLRPDQPGADEHNIAILRHCVEDFAREDMLLVVEFLTYELEGEEKAAYKEKIPSLVEAGTRISLDCGAKVLKLPYPGTAAACANVSKMAGDVPWAVLSAGVDHATFLTQIETAMENGASGVIAGRALWKDCIALDRAVTRDRLAALALPRLREIQSLIGRYGASGKGLPERHPCRHERMQAIGIDVGGTNLRVARVSQSARSSKHAPGGSAAIPRLRWKGSFAAKARLRDVAAIGVGIPAVSIVSPPRAVGGFLDPSVLTSLKWNETGKRPARSDCNMALSPRCMRAPPKVGDMS